MDWTTHLEKIVQQYPNHLGFCETSGIFVGGIWIELYGTETSIIWSHPWPDEITNKLAPETNIWGTITNSNLEIATIFPQEVTLISSIPEVVMTAPQRGSKKYWLYPGSHVRCWPPNRWLIHNTHPHASLERFISQPLYTLSPHTGKHQVVWHPPPFIANWHWLSCSHLLQKLTDANFEATLPTATNDNIMRDILFRS